jgi:hypothetical protein
MKGCNSCAQGQHIGARVIDGIAVGCALCWVLVNAPQQSAAVRSRVVSDNFCLKVCAIHAFPMGQFGSLSGIRRGSRSLEGREALATE